MTTKKQHDCSDWMHCSAKKCSKCNKSICKLFLKHSILIIIAVSIALIAILGVHLNEDNLKAILTKHSTSTSSNNIKATHPNDATLPVPTENTIYNIGDTFKNSYLAIKCTSKDTDFRNYNNYSNIKSGHKVIQASFDFENLGTNVNSISAYNFDCYADGYACTAFRSVDDAAFSLHLSSGRKASVNVYFQVPIHANEIALEYITDAPSNNKVIFNI